MSAVSICPVFFAVFSNKAVIGIIKAYNPEEDGEYTIIENRDSYRETLMKAFPYNKVERTGGYGKWKNPDCRYC